jgi:hypothetical protein
MDPTAQPLDAVDDESSASFFLAFELEPEPEPEPELPNWALPLLPPPPVTTSPGPLPTTAATFVGGDVSV